MKRAQVVRLALAVEGGMLLLAWGLGELAGVPAFHLLEPTWRGAGQGVVAGLALCGGLLPAIRWRWPPFARLRSEVRLVVERFFLELSVFDLALISALAGLGEETLFRGVLQPVIAGRLGSPIAILITGVVFGFAHLISPTYAAMAALIGVLLGVLLVTFDNLLVPIVAHAVFDFVALVYFVRRRTAAHDSVVVPRPD